MLTCLSLSSRAKTTSNTWITQLISLLANSLMLLKGWLMQMGKKKPKKHCDCLPYWHRWLLSGLDKCSYNSGVTRFCLLGVFCICAAGMSTWLMMGKVERVAQQASTDELLVAQGWFIQHETGTHLQVYATNKIKKTWKQVTRRNIFQPCRNRLYCFHWCNVYDLVND